MIKRGPIELPLEVARRFLRARSRARYRRTTVERNFITRCGMDGVIVRSSQCCDRRGTFLQLARRSPQLTCAGPCFLSIGMTLPAATSGRNR
jgi:hypothetical protein